MERLASRDQVFMTRLTEILHANLANENFGVNDFALQSGMSHYQLSKRIHSVTGKTIIHFIRETRLRKALEMLQENELTVAEIAYKNGFGSATYFTSTFTEHFGYSPVRVKKGDIDVSGELNYYNHQSAKYKNRIPGIFFFRGSGAFLMILFLFCLFLVNSEKRSTFSVFLSAYNNTVAVLPFKNLSDSTGNQYFADGISEDILTYLSMVDDLKVVSRTSVEQFRVTTLSASEIASKLKVNYIIEGSIQKSGNSFRLWIQLIDARSSTHLFSEVYNGRYTDDMLGFQTNTASLLAVKIKATILNKQNNSTD